MDLTHIFSRRPTLDSMHSLDVPEHSRSFMQLVRRRFLQLVAGATAWQFTTRTATAQRFPSRPVRIIVPTAAGGAADILARLVSQWLSDRLGQQFVAENRPGGGSNVGTEVVVKAPA